jgi:hypothetical protein
MKKMMILCLCACVLSMLAAVPVGHAQATNTTLHFNSTFTGTQINPCNGEPVLLVIDRSVVIHRTFDNAGGIHLHNTVNLHGDGVGLVTGADYRLNSISTAHTTITQGANNQTLWQDAVAIGKGDVPNFLFQETEHITINANDEVTVVFSHEFTKCQ